VQVSSHSIFSTTQECFFSFLQTARTADAEEFLLGVDPCVRLFHLYGIILPHYRRLIKRNLAADENGTAADKVRRCQDTKKEPQASFPGSFSALFGYFTLIRSKAAIVNR